MISHVLLGRINPALGIWKCKKNKSDIKLYINKL